MSPLAEDYQRIFDVERAVSYPAIDALESSCGFAVDRARLEDAARVLACPIKKHAPNWQHGRLLYAVTRRYLADHASSGPFTLVDVGTAKGFSALCLTWALRDAGAIGTVTSTDVLHPDARVRRNTVAECEGYRTLPEILSPWSEAAGIRFLCGTGAEALAPLSRVHLAYLDGKHTYEVVREEATHLASRQLPGDVVVFDDAQIEGVRRAIEGARASYDVLLVEPMPSRQYAIGVRRG